MIGSRRTAPPHAAQRYLPPYSEPPFFFSVPSSKCFVRLMGFILLALHFVHSSFSTIFFVVFAFFLNTGLVWPPKPACFLSYRRLPWAVSDVFPVFGMFTIATRRAEKRSARPLGASLSARCLE